MTALLGDLPIDVVAPTISTAAELQAAIAKGEALVVAGAR